MKVADILKRYGAEGWRHNMCTCVAVVDAIAEIDRLRKLLDQQRKLLDASDHADCLVVAKEQQAEIRKLSAVAEAASAIVNHRLKPAGDCHGEPERDLISAEMGMGEQDRPDWLIVFEDDRRPEPYTTEESARARLEQAAISWNCHLFRRVESK